MTPAINAARKAKIKFTVHKYEHDSSASSYGDEAATRLGLSGDRVFKTLIAAVDTGELVVAVIPVSKQLDLKSFASALGAKRSHMADQKDAERATGYLIGGISPLGQRKKLRTVVDECASAFQTIYVSAGRRGLEIELSPPDLNELTNGCFAAITR